MGVVLNMWVCCVNVIIICILQAEFFNNYIADPDRPMPLEPSIKSSVLPPNPKTPSSEESPTLGVMSPLGGSGGGPPPVLPWVPEAQMMHILRTGA